MNANIRTRIASARESIDELKEQIDGLKAAKRPEGMLWTFDANDARLLAGKLDDVDGYLGEALKAKKDDESRGYVVMAATSLGSAYRYLSTEVADFNREMLRFQAEAQKQGIWARYSADLKRSHEKFMAIAEVALELVKRIPTLAV